jgi:hypothetical protein
MKPAYFWSGSFWCPLAVSPSFDVKGMTWEFMEINGNLHRLSASLCRGAAENMQISTIGRVNFGSSCDWSLI